MPRIVCNSSITNTVNKKHGLNFSNKRFKDALVDRFTDNFGMNYNSQIVTENIRRESRINDIQNKNHECRIKNTYLQAKIRRKYY